MRDRVKDESGVVSVLVAAAILALVGFLALVVDMGAVYVAKRELSQASDAAALAAAQEVARGSAGCPAVALDYLTANSPEAQLEDCQHDAIDPYDNNPYDNDREVEVIATRDVPLMFAAILGRNTVTIRAASEAEFGPLRSSTGLRPFGLCTASPAFLAWQASGHSSTQVFRVSYTKASPQDCGTAVPGNWGLLDFDGGSNSTNTLRSWVIDGYPGVVSVPAWHDGDPGAFSNALDIHTIVGETVYLPVFDVATGSGANSSFHVEGIVAVTIVGYQATGSQASRYLDLRFESHVISGDCCDDEAGALLNTGLLGIRLCELDDAGHCD